MTFVDPGLKVLQISDFSPGVVRFSNGNYATTYPLSSTPASAAHAYRCFYRPGVGLCPFPSYSAIQTFTLTNGTGNASTLNLAGMKTLPAATAQGDSLVSVWQFQLGSTVSAREVITRLDVIPGTNSTPTNVYDQTYAGQPIGIAPTLDIGVFQDPGNTNAYARVVLTVDIYGQKAVTIPDWHTPVTPADNFSGALPSPSSSFTRAFYHANRAGFWAQQINGNTTDGFMTTAGDVLNVSALDSLASYSLAGLFFPELGEKVAAWGSVSTGEFVAIYDTGGAVLINGDLFAPSSVIKLPAVQGTGAGWGPGVATTQGLVYVTSHHGAWSWNGGNSSSKISSQVPDDQLARPAGGVGKTFAGHDAWGQQWIMFPNNWVYDLITGGWWQCEDPGVLTFMVHTKGSQDPRFMYSSPGLGSQPGNTSNSVSTYLFDNMSPVTTWEWMSNPITISSPGALADVKSVEVCATNPNATTATIVVQPTVPSGFTDYPNANPTQTLTFTIPANTTAWRGTAMLGYRSYNVQLKVTANGGVSQAPILHEITVGYGITEPSNVAGV